MGISQYDPAARGLPAWNAGRQVGAKRALKVRQILLGHTKIENTVRYLGVDVEDALELAEHTEV